MKTKEKGSVTLIVLVTVLFIVILLSSFLVYINTKRRSQIGQTEEIEKNYDGNMSEIYSEVALKDLSYITGMETENTEAQDKNGNKITIPAGFKVVNPEEDVTKGIVIEDISAGDNVSKGNQYVWIPVTHVNEEKINTLRDDSGKEHIIELARYTFDIGNYNETMNKYSGSGQILTKTIDRNNIKTYYVEETEEEHIASKYENVIAKDIENFKESVKNKGGYYIARYEAGDSNSTNNRTSSSSQTVIPVFKDNQIVYNYIKQPNAANLVRNLYANKNIQYTSDLVNSYAWDTSIIFIQEFSGDTDYSIQNSIKNSLSKTGQAIYETNKDVRCNIYDMAGNVLEWCTETCSLSEFQSSYRGGDYYNKIYYTSNRNGGRLNECYDISGFRRNIIFKLLKK